MTSISYTSREITYNAYVVIWKFGRGPVGRSLTGFVGFFRIMKCTENHQTVIRLLRGGAAKGQMPDFAGFMPEYA